MNYSGRFRRRAGSLQEELTLLAPLALIAVITVLSFATPSHLYFSRFLSLAPAFAASLWPVAATVAIGALAVAIDVAVAVSFGRVDAMSHTHLFTLVIIVGATAAAACASHVRQKREQASPRSAP